VLDRLLPLGGNVLIGQSAQGVLDGLQGVPELVGDHGIELAEHVEAPLELADRTLEGLDLLGLGLEEVDHGAQMSTT